jgi:hypothetical protein
VASSAQAQSSISINSSANLPPGVDQGRFAALGAAVARGWRIRVAGETDRSAGRRDGVNALGFSPALPPGVLGAYEAWGRRSYALRCRRTSAGRRCRRVQRDVVHEADVSISTAFNWNQGPRYPTIDEVDLESVLIHEVGHFANPRARHATGCANSPLVESLSSGEWWRGANDWFRAGCPNSPRRPVAGARARGARAAGPEHEFRIVRHIGPAVKRSISR